MKQMGKKQFIGGPLTAVLAVAAGHLFGIGPAAFVVWGGLVYFFVVPLGLGRKASGSVGTDDSYGDHDGGHGSDHGGDGGGG